ncbi:fasciclin-like arabinogalactan protein 6 [Panicum miliaceum]|uniref:Fasciclin-like arabinogalactan protein 6 n=1 Tax=Panicum miliaceum TaxID=4540 RepID=A0A3L6RTT3_PANMI|nr:fasciclin-like arabinogalactan protein 6 [Panicum miliaceum]
MASHTALPLLLLLPFLFAAAADDVAPGSSPPGELNLTRILESGGQYSTLLRLLQATRITEQLTSQLKNSYDGLTFFAPNDNAFTKLKTGTLNGLTDQQKIQLLLYHVLPRYYSVTTFQTASNPLPTEASGPGGMYSVNVTTTTTSHLVNMSTGVVDVPISSTLSAKFPLAVYSVDDVLLPEQLFGTSHKGMASAPAPTEQAGASAGKASAGKKGGVPKSDVALEPVAAGEGAEDSNNAAAGRGSAGWTTIAAFALIMAVVNLVGA